MNQQLDPVSVAITVLASFLSPAVGAVLGPYAVIFLASSTGAGWSLGRRETSTKGNAFWFFVRVNLTAGLLTYAAAEAVMHVYKVESVGWLFAPIAFCFGLVGDDWPAVRRWLLDRLLSWRTASKE